MQAIRGVMTFFLMLVLMVSWLGWRWSADLPSPKWEGARAALTMTALSAVLGLVLLWNAKPRKS